MIGDKGKARLRPLVAGLLLPTAIQKYLGKPMGMVPKMALLFSRYFKIRLASGMAICYNTLLLGQDRRISP